LSRNSGKEKHFSKYPRKLQNNSPRGDGAPHKTAESFWEGRIVASWKAPSGGRVKKTGADNQVEGHDRGRKLVTKVYWSEIEKVWGKKPPEANKGGGLKIQPRVQNLWKGNCSGYKSQVEAAELTGGKLKDTVKRSA